MNKKVLIIEDDNDTAELVEILIRELDDEVVSFAHIISVSNVESIQPDLILLDHWINNGLGGILCKALKQNDSTKHIPIILVSAVVNIKEIANEAGADDFLAKPFDISDLQNTVSKFLKQNRNSVSMSDKKTPKESSQLFHNIIKASVSPKATEKKDKKEAKLKDKK